MDLKIKNFFILPSILFIFSFALRLSLISKGPLELDALTFAINTELSINSGKLHFLHSHGFPLSALIGSLAFYIAKKLSYNDPVIVLNFVSVIFSSLCVVFVYQIGKLIFDTPTGLLSATLVSISPIFLGCSVFANTHIISLLFILPSFCLLLSKKSLQTKDLVFASCLLGLAGAARIQDMLVILPAFIVTLSWRHYTDQENKKTFSSLWQRLFLINGVIVIIITLFYAPVIFSKFLDHTHPVNTVSQFFIFEIISRFKGLFSSYILYAIKFLIKNFSLPGILLLTLGFILLAIQQKMKGIILFLWSFIPIVLLGSLNIITPRFLIVALIPLYLIEGYLVVRFLQYNKIFKIIIGLVLGSQIYLTFSYTYPILKFRHQHALLPDYARWFAKHTDATAWIIVHRESAAFFSYYGKRSVFRRPLAEFKPLQKNELLAFQQKLDSLLDQGIPVYATELGIFGH